MVDELVEVKLSYTAFFGNKNWLAKLGRSLHIAHEEGKPLTIVIMNTATDGGQYVDEIAQLQGYIAKKTSDGMAISFVTDTVGW